MFSSKTPPPGDEISSSAASDPASAHSTSEKADPQNILNPDEMGEISRLFHPTIKESLDFVTQAFKAGIKFLKTQDLHQAALNGNLTKLEEILKEMPDLVEARLPFDPRKLTVLQRLAFMNNVVGVELLRRHGANPNTTDARGWTALHFAAASDHIEIMALLRSAEADIDARDEEGDYTPLHTAIARGKNNAAKELILWGADPNAKDKDGSTPLHYAAITGNLELVNFLLQHRANPNAKSKSGDTALHCASARDLIDVMKALLQANASINETNNTGWSALHYAAMRGHPEAVEFLINFGANINAKDANGSTPLHYARQSKVVRVLRLHGADIYIKNNKNETVLDIYPLTREILDLLEEAVRNASSAIGNTPVRKPESETVPVTHSVPHHVAPVQHLPFPLQPGPSEPPSSANTTIQHPVGPSPF